MKDAHSVQQCNMRNNLNTRGNLFTEKSLYTISHLSNFGRKNGGIRANFDEDYSKKIEAKNLWLFMYFVTYREEII